MNQEAGSSILGKCNLKKKEKRKVMRGNEWRIVGGKRVGRVVGRPKQEEIVRGCT